MQVRCAGAHGGVQPRRGGDLSPEHSRCRHSGEYLPFSSVIFRVISRAGNKVSRSSQSRGTCYIVILYMKIYML